jgi:hypothetical protein
MKSIAAFSSLLIVIGSSALPAAARDSYVVDNAHLLSATTISAINAKVADFNATAHKEVVVDTEPTAVSLDTTGEAEKIFAQRHVNGILIFVVKAPPSGLGPESVFVPGPDSRFFRGRSGFEILDPIGNAYDSGDFNGAIPQSVDLALAQYRSQLAALKR